MTSQANFVTRFTAYSFFTESTAASRVVIIRAYNLGNNYG